MAMMSQSIKEMANAMKQGKSLILANAAWDATSKNSGHGRSSDGTVEEAEARAICRGLDLGQGYQEADFLVCSDNSQVILDLNHAAYLLASLGKEGAGHYNGSTILGLIKKAFLLCRRYFCTQLLASAQEAAQGKKCQVAQIVNNEGVPDLKVAQKKVTVKAKPAEIIEIIPNTVEVEVVKKETVVIRRTEKKSVHTLSLILSARSKIIN
ncbi:hypothetical protein GIB67_037162 [Kingdonia uniflora]|uniref:Uncharacterized protein n=1 Tax=Kingdonia uniflora TaxID=39325 RepID=A0A7J7MRL9_9MAGN|nr:hypothetical protein GIB67_037162 [Kingdonia uniflora]